MGVTICCDPQERGENMNFELSEDHLSVQKLTREFAAKTIAPGLRDRDRENRFDRNILSKMAESDILGI